MTLLYSDDFRRQSPEVRSLQFTIKRTFLPTIKKLSYLWVRLLEILYYIINEGMHKCFEQTNIKNKATTFKRMFNRKNTVQQMEIEYPA